MRTFGSRLWSIALVQGAVALVLLSTSLRAEVVEARRAYDFVDSLGVVAHVSRSSGVLDNEGWSTIIHRIDEAGFRYVRTTITNEKGRSRVEDAYETYGIRFNLRIDTRPLDGGDPKRTHLNPDRLDEMVEMTKAAGPDAILSFEGPNEYNGQEEYNREWDIELKDFMLQLYTRVKNDPDIADKPVIAPSIKNRDYECYCAVGDISDRTDRGNLHNYASGQQPSYDLDNRIADAKTMTPDDPIWVTEYGYRVANGKRVSEDVQAKYLARYAGEFFIRPTVERVFQYQIIDEASIAENPGKAWGLLRYDHSPRPAFYAMKNTIALLDDAGADYTPGTLDFDLIGDVTDVHSFLVQKKSGVFYLVLWQEVESWDWTNFEEVNPPDRPLSLKLNTPVDVARTYLPTAVGIYNPEDGRLPLRSYDNPDVIELSVPDQLLVVEMIPGGSLAATATADPITGKAPQTVQFDGSATPSPEDYTYSWDFGDGTSSGARHPSHTYALPGTYTAVLTIDDGTDTAQDSVQITVLEGYILGVTAGADPIAGDVPLTVQFSASVDPPTASVTYSWDFGDGAVASASSPSHTYTLPGAYTAVLTVDDGTDTAQGSVEISASQAYALNATAEADPVAGTAPLTVQFNSTVGPPGASVTYAWDFGDGTTSGIRNPSHAYALPGTYTAVLTVDDGTHGAQDTIDITVLATEDSVPPGAPGNLTAELAPDNVIVLSWSASADNVGVAGYRIYDGSALKGTTADTSYEFQAQRNRWYTFTITALDAADNESAPSDRVKAYIYKTRLIVRS
jgi:PKD repeat protein